MKLTRATRPHPGLMQFVGVLDVVFLLLIFFLLGQQVITQSGVAVDPPLSPFTLAPARQPEIITLTADAVSAIYFRNERVTPETLALELKGEGSPDRTIIIKADRQTSYERVFSVVNLCLAEGFSVALATAGESE